MKAIVLIAVFWALLAAENALLAGEEGCPVVLSASDFRPRLPHVNRNQFKLFVLRRDPQVEWQSAKLQIDWRDDEGHLLLPDSKSKRLKELYEASRELGYSDNDRFVFEANRWGDGFQKGDPVPCPTNRIYELSDSQRSKFAYIAICKPAGHGHIEASGSSPYKFDPEKRFVATPGYQFVYSESNHILFDKIVVDGLEVGKAAEMRIWSDVKRFFTLDFESGDVESTIASHRTGPMGFLANLTFYLRILFFKIDLELNTGMSFFSNAVHIPMVLHMPVDAHEWLHPASGTMYSWEIDPGVVELDANGRDMPLMDTKLVKGGWKAAGKDGLKYCKQNICTYWLRGRFGNKDFAMKYIIPRALVKLGFYPMLSMNAQRSEFDLGWRDEDEIDTKKTRVGVYFESSGLKKGEHDWEFWIQLGKLGENSVCPETAEVARVFDF